MDNSPLAFQPHDHSSCRGGLLAAAEALCAERGLRLTPVRLRTLEILSEQHRALGAYEVLDRLKEAGFGGQPPVAYRALEFLVDNGLAHRIQRLNAFVACMHAASDHSPAFFICEACKIVAEAPAAPIRSAVDAAAQGLGFQIARVSLEAVGRCPACAACPA